MKLLLFSIICLLCTSFDYAPLQLEKATQETLQAQEEQEQTLFIQAWKEQKADYKKLILHSILAVVLGAVLPITCMQGLRKAVAFYYEPHRHSLRQLSVLEQQARSRQMAPALFCTRLEEVYKEYLSATTHQRVEGMTKEELLQCVTSIPSQVKPFLEIVEQIKFAKATPSYEQAFAFLKEINTQFRNRC